MDNALGLVVAAFASVLLAASAEGAAPPLFDNGRTEWTAVVPADASACVRYAAREFTNAVFRVSGVSVSIVSSKAGVAHAVRFAADGEEWAKEKVRYALEDGDLVFGGNQSRAVLEATYAFLQRELGCRWLWPGEDGAFYPQARKWAFPAKFGFAHEPSVWFRGFHHCGEHRDIQAFIEWETRNFSNIHRHGNAAYNLHFGHYSMPSMHNANLNGEKKLFAEHPECFALLGGKRSMANVCFSSERGAQAVADRIGADIVRREKAAPVDVISIFPNDNQDYCQCDKCKVAGVSTGWFAYYNQVVRILRSRFPRLRFATIAYQGYLDPPKCRIENTEFIEYASHLRCHIHRWDDPACERNARELKRLKAWLARGDVAIGHYAYEYDALDRHSMFLPFFSVVGDACEKANELGLVTQIPEVILSPKGGPDARAWSVQNRLSELYYTRKTWDAQLTLDAFLDDTCRTAFGAAAAPLKEYFLLMDGAWLKMPGAIGLFSDGQIVAASLLENETVRTRSAALIAEAERLAKEQGDARLLRNVLCEKTLYRQIVDNREQRLGQARSFNLPRVAKGGRPPKGGAPVLKLESASGKAGRCAVSGYWSPDDELVVAFAKAKDAELRIVDEDSERYAFAWKDGWQSQRRVSDVGVEVANWTPAWTARKKGSGVVFRIPLAAFRRKPSVNAAWEMRFAADGEACPFAADTTLRAAFLAAPAVDRPIVFYAGDPRCLRNAKELRTSAEADGWKLIGCTNKAELAAAVTQADTYLFQVPKKGCVDPETAAVIRERVKNGGSLVVRSWWAVPLDEYLGDPALKTHVEAIKNVPLSDRHATDVREGDWCRRPWNFERAIRRGFAPCTLLVGDAPADAWVAFAKMASRAEGHPDRPFLSAMKYGKGVIVLVGETLQISHFRILDNIRQEFGLTDQGDVKE